MRKYLLILYIVGLCSLTGYSSAPPPPPGNNNVYSSKPITTQDLWGVKCSHWNHHHHHHHHHGGGNSTLENKNYINLIVFTLLFALYGAYKIRQDK